MNPQNSSRQIDKNYVLRKVNLNFSIQCTY